MPIARHALRTAKTPAKESDRGLACHGSNRGELLVLNERRLGVSLLHGYPYHEIRAIPVEINCRVSLRSGRKRLARHRRGDRAQLLLFDKCRLGVGHLHRQSFSRQRGGLSPSPGLDRQPTLLLVTAVTASSVCSFLSAGLE